MRAKSLGNTVSGLIGITIFSQIIAFVRESIFAYYYGTSLGSDAFVMASQIPVTLFAIVSTSISTVILPIYTSKQEKEGEKSAHIFLKSSVLLFCGLCLILVLLCEILPVPLVKIFAPNFKGESLRLTIKYVRILFPTIIFTVMISILTVYYNARNNFIYPAIVALSHNLFAIIGMVLFAKKFDIDAIVWGTFIGIIINAMLLLLPHFEVLTGKPDFKRTWNDFKSVIAKVIPVTIGVGIAEINRIIDRAVASGLDTGSITALNYANKLSVVFSALILSAVSTVSFKRFSEMYVKNKHNERNILLIDYVSLLLIILVPVTIGAIILKRELIIVAFGRGAFDISSVTQTANIFFYSSLGIAFIAVREILSKFFYSSGDTKTPMLNAGIGVLINIVLNLILSKFMGASGLALATTISNVTVCILLFINICKIETQFPKKQMLINTLRITLVSLIMLVFLIALNAFYSIPSSLIKIVVYLFVGVIVYFLSFLVIDKKMMKRILSLLIERFSS